MDSPGSYPNSTPDFTYLQEVSAGNNGLFLNLLVAVSKSLGKYPPLIEAAANAGDSLALKQYAHKFKSGIAYLGDHAFDRVLERLEAHYEQRLGKNELAKSVAEMLFLATSTNDKVLAKIENLLSSPS